LPPIDIFNKVYLEEAVSMMTLTPSVTPSAADTTPVGVNRQLDSLGSQAHRLWNEELLLEGDERVRVLGELVEIMLSLDLLSLRRDATTVDAAELDAIDDCRARLIVLQQHWNTEVST